MNFLVLNIVLLVFLSNLFQILIIFITFLLICNSCKNLVTNLNIRNGIYGKNGNESLVKSDIHEYLNEEGIEVTILNGKSKGKFVCKNIINISKQKLSNSSFTFIYGFEIYSNK